MMRRTAIGIPRPRPTFTLSESVGVGGDGEMGRAVEVEVEVAMETDVVFLEICPDVRLVGVVFKVVVELGNVGTLWTSVIAASVRRDVGMPDVGGNHGVRFGFMRLPSCGWGPQPQPIMAAPKWRVRQYGLAGIELDHGSCQQYYRREQLSAEWRVPTKI
jgi:hypothetical protein